ncbi:hypothetical protein KA001_01905 [Patescibacteria group bacterium]|nr:hypothetical protein [Patescibacteria group bacterium]
MKINKIFSITALIALLFAFKLWLNSFLLAENGDTYDFFKIAYSIQNNNWLYESKRMPFLPLLLSIFPSEWFVWIGRIWINLFYFASIFVFYKILRIYIKSSSNQLTSKLANQLTLGATIIFATNLIIFENSFYILADTIFLFFNLLYLYLILKKNYNALILAIISLLAFYTRPEGLILVIVTLLIYFKLNKNILKNSTKYIALVIFGLIPYILKSYYILQDPLKSGYFDDKAGFIFTTESVLERISNFTFFTGGFFLIPLLILCINLNWNRKKTILLIFNPIFLIFILNSILLFLWGPYPRLYSILIAMCIIGVFKILINSKDSKFNMQRVFLAILSLIALACFYIYATQVLHHNDFGYTKYGKGISILFSFLIIFLSVIYTKFKWSFNKFILIFTIFVVFLNIAVFTDKFNITRYKYYSIKLCIEKYIDLSKDNKKIAYSTLTGLEEWYIKDFEYKYRYLGNEKTFEKWRIENNVNYIITSLESGHKDSLGHIKMAKYPDSKIIFEAKTPFFIGSTKLIKLD